MHPYKATHFENRKSILHFIALMVLQTDSHHNVHINHHITVYTKKTQKSSGKKLGSYKYPGAAIGIHDIMLAGKNLEEVDLVNVCSFAAGREALLFHFA